MDYSYTRDYDRYREHEYRKGYRDGLWDSDTRTRGLRRSRDGMLLGVCKGFSDWLGIPSWPIRLATFITFMASGFWPVGALYLIAAVAMKPDTRA